MGLIRSLVCPNRAFVKLETLSDQPPERLEAAQVWNQFPGFHELIWGHRASRRAEPWCISYLFEAKAVYPYGNAFHFETHPSPSHGRFSLLKALLLRPIDFRGRTKPLLTLCNFSHFSCVFPRPYGMQALALKIFTRNPPVDPEPLESHCLECLDEGRAYQACTASGQVGHSNLLS